MPEAKARDAACGGASGWRPAARRHVAGLHVPLALALALALAAGLGLAPSPASGAAQRPRPATVQEYPTRPFGAVVDHVDDGDSLTVRMGGLSIRVRLDGIDAPEGTQRFGPESRNHLRTLVFDRTVEVRPTGVDRYKRLLARLVVDRRDVGEAMVEAGWAWHYVQYSRDARLAALEKQARAARRGLWADPASRPPWELRAEERGEEPGAAARAGGSRPDAAAPKPGTRPKAPAPAPGPFHGNVNSRVYHAPGCADYNCRRCVAAFPTRQAAEAAGYRPHEACVR